MLGFAVVGILYTFYVYRAYWDKVELDETSY